ncbi:MAG: O-antigen polymerase, partial [Candidatus Hodarchaeota archaeon]
FLIQIIIFNLVVSCTPFLVENNIRNIDTWTHSGATDIIIRDGGWKNYDWSWANLAHSRLQFPGIFILNAIILIITRISILQYFRFYPIFSSTILIFTYFMLLKNIFSKKNLLKFSLIIMILINVWLQFHNSPQSLGIILFPIIMLSMREKSIEWLIISVVTFTSLLFIHSITFLILISMFLMNYIFNYYRKTSYSKKFILLFNIIIFVGWFIFNSNLYLLNIMEVITQISDIINLASTTTYVISRSASKITRIIRAFTVIISSTISMLYILYMEKNKDFKNFFMGWGISACFFIGLNIFLYGSGFENRGFIFLFLLYPILIVRSIWNTKVSKNIKFIMLIIFIMFSVLQKSTNYSEENRYIISESGMSNAYFIGNYIGNEKILGNRLSVVYYFNNNVSFIWIQHYNPEKIFNTRARAIGEYEIYLNFDEFTMPYSKNIWINYYNKYSKNIHSNIIYNNNYYKIYQII